MLMITRTDRTLEAGVGDRPRIAIDMDSVATAALSTERAPCGKIRQVLAVSFRNGSPCIFIEGAAAELGALHQTMTEILLDTQPSRHVH